MRSLYQNGGRLGLDTRCVDSGDAGFGVSAVGDNRGMPCWGISALSALLQTSLQTFALAIPARTLCPTVLSRGKIFVRLVVPCESGAKLCC